MRRKIYPYLILTFLVAMADIISKLCVQQMMTLHESRPVLGHFFHLTYILNSGGVFGSKLGSNTFYLASALAVVLAVVYFLFREFGKNKFIDFTLFLVLGGALGNLFDRVRLGAVVDFLDFDFFNIKLPFYQFDRWPTFNVADAAVSIGMVLLIATLLFGLGKTQSPQVPEHHDLMQSP